MKKIKINLNKRIIFLIILNIVIITLGLLYPAVIKKEIISTKLTTYVESLLNNKYTIKSLISTNITNNILLNSSMYILTIPIISFIILPIIYILKVFSIGVSTSSIIYIYKFKGLLYSVIIMIPSVLNLLILTISFYYALSYFIIMIKYKKNISKRRLLKSFIKIFIITNIFQVVISLIDSYLSFYFFKIF